MDDDPAKHRLMLIEDRRDARGSILLGLLLLLGAIGALALSVTTNDQVLLLGTLIVPAALGFGIRYLLAGVASHTVASFRLRKLHARQTGLPSARLVD